MLFPGNSENCLKNCALKVLGLRFGENWCNLIVGRLHLLHWKASYIKFEVFVMSIYIHPSSGFDLEMGNEACLNLLLFLRMLPHN